MKIVDKRTEGHLQEVTYEFEEPFMLNAKSQNRFVETVIAEMLEGLPPEGMVVRIKLYFGKPLKPQAEAPPEGAD